MIPNYQSLFCLYHTKRVCFLLFVLCKFSNILNAQDSIFSCGQDVLHQKLLSTDKDYAMRHEHYEAMTYRFSKIKESKTRIVYTIPVIVHVVALPGTPINSSENISNIQVQNALQQLNQAFRKQSPYNTGTYAVDVEIEFCLAQQDINGNSTTGINRVSSALSQVNMATQDAALKALTQSPNLFPSTNYMNIWVVKEICSQGNCNVAGYATLAAAHGSLSDGIVCEAGYFGLNPNNTKVLVHEAGHYFNLYHTFRGRELNLAAACLNDNCLNDGDKVCDTPADNTLFSCNTTNSCLTDVNVLDPNNPFMIEQNDMVENYLDYSGLGCMNTFTQGQKNRMLIALTTIRSSLLNTSSCVPPVYCGMNVNFSASTTTAFINSTINFTNTTTATIPATSYIWKINSIAVGNALNFSYLFNAAGVYEVCLEATNSVCTRMYCSQIKIESLIISPIASMNAAINNLLGNDIAVSNISVNCNQTIPSIAYYDANFTNLGLTQGILLTSGDANLAKGPNISGSSGTNANATGDADLTTLAGVTTYDACAIEFDIVPNCDTLRIKYMFASEEFPEYIFSYNDIFAFFVTGGIYTNTNIATLPNGTTTVSIYNVNNGSSNTGPCVNCAYYQNHTGSQHLQYDGSTTILQSKFPVLTGMSYHVKIAVADAADYALDSGVFIEADGITCNTPPWGPFPIEFLYFMAEALPQNDMDKKCRLEWQLSMDIPIKSFEIERRNKGQSFFEKIGYIVDTNGQNEATYQFEDTLSSTANNMLEYRIKGTDQAGKVSYSEIRQVSFGDINEDILVNAYPNPVVDMLNLKILYQESKDLTWHSMNVLGQDIQIEPIYLGNYLWSIDMTDYPGGLYSITVKNKMGRKKQMMIFKK